MSEGALQVAGGLGVFLLAMFVMTDGLKQLAGRSLRGALKRFTHSPTSGAVAGALTTAVIQSSSATTVTAVGFVGAGLLTFAEALGIIFGANAGTTITGWLVALFGFKVPLDTLAFPIVLIGALTRIFGRGRWSAVGQAVAGFGLLFVGIDLLQSGLAGLEGSVTPEDFPPNTWFGRVQLVGIGVLVTLVTQSSSAGVAMALASVNAGTISFPQAAAIVIGMDIGTTVTAAMAVVGGGTQVKRTGLAHVVYNCLTGFGAFFLLVPYVEITERVAPGVLEDQPELLLVGFHTLFNSLGVLAVLPFAGRFARMIERLVPPPHDDPTHALGRSLLSEPDAALDVVERTLRDITAQAMGRLTADWETGSEAGRGRAGRGEEVARLRTALAETRSYTTEIATDTAGPELRFRHDAAFHVEDHLGRLLARLDETDRLLTAANDTELRAFADPVVGAARETAHWLREDEAPVVAEVEDRVHRVVAEVEPIRIRVIEDARKSHIDAGRLASRLDAVRWIGRTAQHVGRLALHLDQLANPVMEPGAEAPDDEG